MFCVAVHKMKNIFFVAVFTSRYTVLLHRGIITYYVGARNWKIFNRAFTPNHFPTHTASGINEVRFEIQRRLDL